MRVSVALPTCMEGMIYPIPFASPEQLVQIVERAESLGYHSVWGNDHMTTQAYVRQRFDQPPRYWEPLVTYAYLAARTRRIRFGTGVLVTPLRRDIVVLAKQIATLDQFSGGRLLVGVGVGAYREEFEALQPGRKVHRGRLLEESLRALRTLFNEREASFRGTYYSFHDVQLFPKPKQQPLPLYVGGNSLNAVRRAARYGQGWMPAALPAHQLLQRLEVLRSEAEIRGRDPGSLETAPQMVVLLARTHEEAVSRFRRSQMYHHLLSLQTSTLRGQEASAFEDANLIGTPDEVAAKARDLRAAGVTHLAALLFAVNTVSEFIEQMSWFAEEIVPLLEDAKPQAGVP